MQRSCIDVHGYRDIANSEPLPNQLRRKLFNHRDNPQENRAADPKTAAFDFLTAKGPPDRFSIDDDFDSGAGGHLIHEANVRVRDGSEESMRHQSALDLVPDLAEAGIEFLSSLLVFHVPGRRLTITDASMRS
jgi:hypothetical protein